MLVNNSIFSFSHNVSKDVFFGNCLNLGLFCKGLKYMITQERLRNIKYLRDITNIG